MRVLPGGLAGRTILIMLAAVALVHLGSVALYESGMESMLGRGRIGEVADRLVSARQVLEARRPAEREAVAHDLSAGSLRLHWTADPSSACPATRDGALGLDQAIESALARRRMPVAEPVSTGADHGDGTSAAGCLPLADGSRLAFQIVPLTAAGAETHATLLSTTVMVLGIVAIAGVLMRRVTAPLRRLVGAADAIGRTADPAPVAETGPDEVRNVAQAFNAMQTRIQHLVNDRTQALAAVSHDLRTPITRLRLRAGFIEDRAVQRQIDADLDDMEAMIAATLAYLRGEQDTETPRRTDLPALLTTLVDAAADAGHAATYTGPAHAAAIVRPLALKRALGNLIDNSVTYGGSARVLLWSDENDWRIAIEDDGPGIADQELDRVFEPFQRLEQSRNRGTGGVGLGLTIARQAIQAEGGTLSLKNRAGGGLTACIRLPGANLVMTPESKGDDHHGGAGTQTPAPHGGTRRAAA